MNEGSRPEQQHSYDGSGSPSPDYLGHRQRLRERYAKGGLDQWQDYEILEFALTFALPRRDTKPIAKALIRAFGSLCAVLEARPDELAAVKGMGDTSAMFLNLLRDTARVYARAQARGAAAHSASTPAKVFEYLSVGMKGLGDENVRALFMNRMNEITADELLATGTVDATQVHTRKIVERALFHKASRVILAHNHPSGSLEPSGEDVDMTEKIRDALGLVEIELVDHVIVGRSGYFSFADAGLI